MPGKHVCPADTGDNSFSQAALSPIVLTATVYSLKTFKLQLSDICQITQHIPSSSGLLSMWRDLDIVAVNTLSPWRNHHLIPFGPLQEPLTAFYCAGKISVPAQSRVKDRVRKLSSLQLCMQLNDPSPNFGYKPVDSSKNKSGNIWDYSDNEAAPASSWSTLPNPNRKLSVDGLKGASFATFKSSLSSHYPSFLAALLFDAVTLFHGAEAETVCRVQLAEKSKSKKVPSLQHASSSFKK
ncbi:tubby-like protein 8 [Tanacetum coccineum]